MRNIVLVGFMGVGKTTTGQLLAKKLKRRFIDLDQEIEAKSGKPVSEIFRLHGEEFFREQERLAIRELLPQGNVIIATGGGVMQQPENVDNLKKHGWMVCLEASVDTIISRIGTDKTRPLLNEPNREELIGKLLQERMPSYRLADFTVNTNKITPDEVADRIIAFMLA
jgi:shikimate kinase